MIDLDAHLGHRLEHGKILDLLVNMAVTRRGIGAAGDRDDRRAGHAPVAQTGSEIHGADVLRQANARPVRRASVAVGHVGGGFLVMAGDARDLAIFHFGHRRDHDGREQKIDA